MDIGGQEPAGQWDDELSHRPDDRRRVARRRAFFVVTVVVLVALIALTLAFVGTDKTSAARVSADGTGATTSTIGFATSLPVAATATSLIGSVGSTDTTDTTSSTGTTLVGTPDTSPTTLPRLGTTSTSTSTSTSTTTTTQTPPFQYANHPKDVHGEFSAGTPGCPQPSPNEVFVFDTPTPGSITILRTSNGLKAVGSVTPQGSFDAKVSQNGITERYTGTTSQSSALGTFQHTEGSCSDTFTVRWTFG